MSKLLIKNLKESFWIFSTMKFDTSKLNEGLVCITFAQTTTMLCRKAQSHYFIKQMADRKYGRITADMHFSPILYCRWDRGWWLKEDNKLHNDIEIDFEYLDFIRMADGELDQGKPWNRGREEWFKWKMQQDAQIANNELEPDLISNYCILD